MDSMAKRSTATVYRHLLFRLAQIWSKHFFSQMGQLHTACYNWQDMEFLSPLQTEDERKRQQRQDCSHQELYTPWPHSHKLFEQGLDVEGTDRYELCQW